MSLTGIIFYVGRDVDFDFNRIIFMYMIKFQKAAYLSILAATFIFLSSTAPAAQDDAPVDPKPRVEREIRHLEILITRFMGNALSSSAGVESMNGLLYRFMRDNPGVVRILRTNANGLAVNDVSVSSPQSAPVRNVSAQRWHQYVAQNKTPYYGIDYDDNSGEVMLFYAWPLMTGPDKSRFSGTFAAMIDLSAQIALIDEPMTPFQIAYRGRAFFQHEWEDVDYNEEPLEVSGSKELTIRTEKPLPTRRDAPARARRAPSAEEEAAAFRYDRAGLDNYDDEMPGTGAKTKKSAPEGFATLMNSAILLLLLIIAAMFAYIILKDRFGRRPVSIITDEPPFQPPPKDTADRVVVGSMAEKETRVQPAVATPPLPQKPAAPPPRPTPPSPPPAPPVLAADNKHKAEKGESDKEQQLISKMLKLIKEEFVIMDKKIQMLTDRIDKLEKKR